MSGSTPTLTSYEKQHLELLNGILVQLTRIADAMEGAPAEDELEFSEETIANWQSLAERVNNDLVNAIEKASNDLGEIGKAYNN